MSSEPPVEEVEVCPRCGSSELLAWWRFKIISYPSSYRRIIKRELVGSECNNCDHQWEFHG